MLGLSSSIGAWTLQMIYTHIWQWNDCSSCDYLDPALAWTGVKNSGRGISLSKFGTCLVF
jgi:hypothetical protein